MSENINKRSGETTITSVSVSKPFQKLIKEHNMSATECFRRGVAVTLCDLGVGMYQSEKNEVRSKFMHEFLKRMDDDEKMKKEYTQIKKFMEIKDHLNAITKIAEAIENNDI